MNTCNDLFLLVVVVIGIYFLMNNPEKGNSKPIKGQTGGALFNEAAAGRTLNSFIKFFGIYPTLLVMVTSTAFVVWTWIKHGIWFPWQPDYIPGEGQQPGKLKLHVIDYGGPMDYMTYLKKVSELSAASNKQIVPAVITDIATLKKIQASFKSQNISAEGPYWIGSVYSGKQVTDNGEIPIHTVQHVAGSNQKSQTPFAFVSEKSNWKDDGVHTDGDDAKTHPPLTAKVLHGVAIGEEDRKLTADGLKHAKLSIPFAASVHPRYGLAIEMI